MTDKTESAPVVPMSSPSISSLLAAIQYYGFCKFLEGKGVASPDLACVRSAWNAVYSAVQETCQSAVQGMDAKCFLNESDYEDLWRFEGMASDGDGYDISKDRMKRLAELGVVRWCGKDRYSVTAFGQYVLNERVNLPLETYEEALARCNAESNARIERLNAEALAAKAATDAGGSTPAVQEPVDSMGMPLSCGRPLCSPGDHHPLCKLAQN